MLSQEAIDEFKQIYFMDKRVNLSDEEAAKTATNLFNSLSVIFGIDTLTIKDDEVNNETK